jgi:hypothetical protein
MLEAEQHAPVHGAPDAVMVRFEDGAAVEAVSSVEGRSAVCRPAPGKPLAPVPTRLLPAG